MLRTVLSFPLGSLLACLCSLLASVPTKDPSGESLIISPEEFERIKWASHVQTSEDREAQEQEQQQEKDRMLVATAAGRGGEAGLGADGMG